MATVLFGIVESNEDPDKLGRIQVRLLDFSGDVVLPWLRVVQPLASASLGALVLPEKGDHVVVLGGAGGIDGMVVIGSLYTGKKKPPKLLEGQPGDPLRRGILTPGGNEISVSDEKGKEAILVQTKGGKVSILLDGKATKLELTGKTEVSVTSDSKVAVAAKEIELTAKSTVTVKGSSKVVVDASQVEIGGKASVKVSGASIQLG